VKKQGGSLSFDIGSFVFGSLLGILITAIINHRLAVSRSKDDRLAKAFNDATQPFRDAFIPELIILESSNQIHRGEIYPYLKAAFARQEKAISDFRHSIPEHEVAALDTAWKKYCYPEENDPKDHLFIHYECAGNYKMVDGKPQTVKSREDAFNEARQIAIDNINRLLSFAKLR